MVRVRRLMRTEGAEDFLAATGMSWMKRQASHKPNLLICWCLLLLPVKCWHLWLHIHALAKMDRLGAILQTSWGVDILCCCWCLLLLASLVAHSGPRKKTLRHLDDI